MNNVSTKGVFQPTELPEKICREAMHHVRLAVAALRRLSDPLPPGVASVIESLKANDMLVLSPLSRGKNPNV